MTDKNNVKTTGNTDMESRILEAAKAVFMEKGFAETSMGDIAARAGINRPSLHYYFRTKDRIFQAVFGMIIQKVVPKVERFITAQDVPLSERVASLVDVYYETFRNNPTLPLFIARELNRDVDHIIETIHDTPMRVTLMKIVSSLRAEMAAGKLNTVPLHVLFYTFYGAMAFPFLTKNLYERLSTQEEGTFDEMWEQWKTYVVRQMDNLLRVK
ncbi:uncharacterized protein BN773_00078 [Prevotella sp. CAG:755]|nr:uncharacterized protein BN773_00078 [Prevotella sp. CAG:755]